MVVVAVLEEVLAPGERGGESEGDPRRSHRGGGGPGPRGR